MWQYIFFLFKRQPGKSALVGSGFLLAACALVLLSATTQTTVLQATQIIDNNWRSTYDLIVLPPQADLSRQKILPADALTNYNGGISIQQYQQIKQLPGISVAAPVAYIGYVYLPSPVIYLKNDPHTPGYYRREWTQISFNGQREIVEQRQSEIILLDDSELCHNLLDKASEEKYNAQVAMFAKKGISYGCASLSNGQTFIPSCSVQILLFIEKFLLAAVDPEAENQLVHLDQSIVKGRMLTAQDTASFVSQGATSSGQKTSTYQLPLLINAHLPGQIKLHLTYAKLATGTPTPQQVLQQSVQNLNALPDQQVFIDQDIPYAEHDPALFSNLHLYWDGHAWQQQPAIDGTGNAFLANFTSPSGLTYLPVPAPTGATEPAYTIVPTGTQGPEVTFRHLDQQSTPQKSNAQNVVEYLYKPVGQFTDTHLAAQFSNPLNWLPESTYAVSPTVLRYDAQGHPVTPTNLLPTTNTAGYVIQPPLALTTLAAAQQIRGDTIISAIRVRVAGIDRADPGSWQRIQQVAASIEQKFHLRVLVTLGSSPKPTLVYIPGVKQGQFNTPQSISPVGWVEERWLALGSSIIYLIELGTTRILLLGTVLIVCLGYLVVSFSALLTTQRTDFAILSALGWRPWQPARLFLAQGLLLSLAGGGGGLGLALLISWLIGAIPVWQIVVWTLPTMLVLALLSSVYPLWQIWQIQPAEILRAGSPILSTKSPIGGSLFRSWVPTIVGLVLRNLTRSRPRTLITIGSLFLSAMLLVLMLSGILVLRQTLAGTLLGEFVLLQTAVPQITGCVFALVLTFLSVADLLLLQVRERRREIGLLRAIGWQPGTVRRMFVQEGLFLALLGTLPGTLTAQWILTIQHATQNSVPMILIILAVICVLILVVILATIPALRAIDRIPLISTMRAE